MTKVVHPLKVISERSEVETSEQPPKKQLAILYYKTHQPHDPVAQQPVVPPAFEPVQGFPAVAHHQVDLPCAVDK